MNNFSATIPGTKGEQIAGQLPKTRQHPGDKPLSAEGQAYLERLWKETDASIRLDEASYGEIRRWSWRTLGELRAEGRQLKAQPAL